MAERTPISRQRAAQGQLETAILLWFTEGDEVSIHTLAVAAQGVLDAICRDRGESMSPMQEVVKAAPEHARERILRPQNFFKHGRYKGHSHDQPVPHDPDLTEIILADCAGVFNRLFGSTPITDLLLLRYAVVFPRSNVLKDAALVELFQGLQIEELARMDREAFYDRMMPVIQGLHTQSLSK